MKSLSWLPPLTCLLLLAPAVLGASVTVKPRVSASPAGTKVTLTLKRLGSPDQILAASRDVPFDLPVVRVHENAQLLVEAQAADHQTKVEVFDYAKCAQLEVKRTDVMELKLQLDRIREAFPVQFTSLTNATYTVDGTKSDSQTELVFNKGDAGWPSRTVRAEAPEHEAVTRTVTYEEMTRFPLKDGRRQIDLNLADRKLTQLIKLLIQNNIKKEPMTLKSDALDGQPEARADGSMVANFRLNRAKVDEEWSGVRVEVFVDRHEWAASPDRVTPSFTQVYTKAELEALNGSLNLQNFEPMKYVMTPVLSYAVDNRGAQLVTNTTFWSAVDPREPGAGTSPVRLVQPTRTTRLVLSTLSVPLDPKAARRMYFPMANYEPNAAGEYVLKGSTIHFRENGLPIALTTRPESQDTDPAVSPNGKLVVFSSLVGGTRCIRQIESKGGIAYPVSEDPRFIDTQPAITDKGRLVFTRRTLNAPPGIHPQIYVQSVDESGQPQARLFGPVCDGHSPSWHPDGNRLAFIDPEDKLCLVTLNDGVVRPLLQGVVHASPSWDTAGKTIYYSAAKEKDERGRRHFDLLRLGISEDGSAAGPELPLTINASMDLIPILSESAGEVLFFSNRGAKAYGDDASLGIFSLKVQ